MEPRVEWSRGYLKRAGQWTVANHLGTSLVSQARPRSRPLGSTPVAQVLAGSIVATNSLLALFGINSDRVWTLLDQDRISGTLRLAVLLAICAVASSICALLFTSPALKALVLIVGTTLYILSLYNTMQVAGHAGDIAGAPLIRAASVQAAGDGATLNVHVGGEKFDPGQAVRVVVSVGSAEMHTSDVPPSSEGTVDHELTVPLPVLAAGDEITVIAWRPDKGEPDCDNLRAHGPACLTLTAPQ